MSIVLKFGGSSISKEGFNTIFNQIKLYENKNIIIVLSALYGITNNLIKIANLCVNNKSFDKVFDNIIQKHNILLKDIGLNENIIKNILEDLRNEINLGKIQIILSYGEKLSTFILYEFLKKKKINSSLENGYNIIKNNNTFCDMNNKYHMKGSFFCDDNIFSCLEKNRILIVPGFVAKTKDGHICTLTRGGSDTTAALIATKIKSEKLEIWTDVNGIYNADPNIIDNAKIINEVDYELCQEMAGMGAKVLHPYCILPCQKENIPIFIKNTYDINNNNTKISNNINSNLSIMLEKNNKVFNISSLDMWNDYGFVADIFLKFKKYSIDINIITTSQYSVLVTTLEKELDKIELLKNDLIKYYDVSIYNCDLISVIGRNIIQNKKIPKLFDKLERHDKIKITHFSSNNMCLSFAVESDVSISIYKKIYNLIFDDIIVSNYKNKWWYDKVNKVRQSFEKNGIYLYDLEVVNKKCNLLKNNLKCVSKIFYAVKANKNIDVLKTIYNNNFGFECVSIEEVKYIRKHFKESNILFIPNYCEAGEYEIAFNFDCNVIVDNYEVIKDNQDIFKDKEIGIRLDLNCGEGHHSKVITEGIESKFGLPLCDISKIIDLCNHINIKIIGLHSHRGSDINNIDGWISTLDKLNILAEQDFDDIKWVDLGGGFGTKLLDNDFTKLNELLTQKKYSNIDIHIEPGRILVSEAGVLLSKVTQIRKKNNRNIIGLSTGMNSLIRPTLYGSYHHIHNLSNINGNEKKYYDIVGPICESGDVFGKNRLLSVTNISDIILIENAGAYGHVMSSKYNMRNPLEEKILENRNSSIIFNSKDNTFISCI